MNIVIPMAGRGSRFSDAGYTTPKPLIDVAGAPMITRVVENLQAPEHARFIFVVLAEHMDEFDLEGLLKQSAPGCLIVPIPEVTRGAAETVLAAREHIAGAPLVITNSDQFVDADLADFYLQLEEADGVILTMTSSDPKWSYVEFAGERICRVVEKDVVSDEATVGIYGFRDGTDFIRAADGMIKRGETSKGEYYVAPTYTYLADEGRDLRVVSIGADGDGMHGLGTPEDLSAFLATPIASALREAS